MLYFRHEIDPSFTLAETKRSDITGVIPAGLGLQYLVDDNLSIEASGGYNQSLSKKLNNAVVKDEAAAGGAGGPPPVSILVAILHGTRGIVAAWIRKLPVALPIGALIELRDVAGSLAALARILAGSLAQTVEQAEKLAQQQAPTEPAPPPPGAPEE